MCGAASAYVEKQAAIRAVSATGKRIFPTQHLVASFEFRFSSFVLSEHSSVLSWHLTPDTSNLQQLLQSRFFQRLNCFAYFLGLLARTDQQGVFRFHNDQVLDPDGHHESSLGNNHVAA